MAIQLVHFSDCGPIRETNQDSYCIRISDTAIGLVGMLVVCDGMGGLSCGEVASATLVTAFGDWYDRRIPTLGYSWLKQETILKEWNALVSEKHQILRNYGTGHAFRLGSTLSIILFSRFGYFVMQVGDSRIYLEDIHKMQLLTKDQTLAMRELEAGHITQEQFRTDMRRNVLLQCIGDQAVSPVFTSGDIPPKGGLLLCSDGFYHTIHTSELHEIFCRQTGKRETQQLLLGLAERARALGEEDNITCVAMRWDSMLADASVSSATVRMDGATVESCVESVAKITFTNGNAL